jgi:hypothetical protein
MPGWNPAGDAKTYSLPASAIIVCHSLNRASESAC